MRNKLRLGIVIFQVLLVAGLGIYVVEAQEQREWSSPFRLSTVDRKSSEAYLTSDQFGYVHVFWTEELEDQRSLLQYARYNGETWSTPVDIRVTEPFVPIGNVSPIVDGNGTLHIAWTEGKTGPAYYASAPAHNATSVQQWQKPHMIKVPADSIKLRVDAQGVLHALYIKFLGDDPGIYYIHSEDQGTSWSNPVWLDPDILPGYGPRALNFEIDDSGGLHALWYYVPIEDTGGDWVRYVHSLDGGNTWSQPFTIDKLDEAAIENEYSLSAAGPVMAVQGQSVHVIWAGGKLHYRHYRYSTDAGQTWSEPERIFGELNGQAFDGMAIDGNGRVHYFAQIRFPMGIYHSFLQGGAWSTPELIYLIRETSADEAGNRIQAHNTHPAIRAGNQVVLTLADNPSYPMRRLFAMVHTLTDVAPLEPAATPTPIGTPIIEQAATPMPTATPLIPSFNEAPSGTSSGSSAPARAVWLGLVPAVFLIGLAFVTRFLIKPTR